MRRVAVLAISCALAATVASAQKVMVPQQTSNPNVILTPPNADQNLNNAKRIPRDEAVKLVKERKAVFVDVRSKESYEAGHIKGAISIPESELITRLHTLPAKKMIITYCA